eukprot:6041323-Prymnesium_polylepis.1
MGHRPFCVPVVSMHFRIVPAAAAAAAPRPTHTDRRSPPGAPRAARPNGPPRRRRRGTWTGRGRGARRRRHRVRRPP